MFNRSKVCPESLCEILTTLKLSTFNYAQTLRQVDNSQEHIHIFFIIDLKILVFVSLYTQLHF